MCLPFGGIPPFFFFFDVSFLIGRLIEMPVHCQLLMGCPDETWHQVKHCDFLDVAVPLIFRSYRASGDFRWWANLIGAARKQANDIDHSVHATRPKMVITTPSKMAPKSRVGSRSRIMSDKCRNYWTRQRRSRGRLGGGVGWGVEKKCRKFDFRQLVTPDPAGCDVAGRGNFFLILRISFWSAIVVGRSCGCRTFGYKTAFWTI